eukprot:CAMPEP_0167756402 /NCGR_PEP_ID=MMETSP0110_2-20121227/9368_1 /TAXON_ID=629695 /ORGANISM="Gymnochlora sp., Strain CCMP2014" /LENGTH=548 /DNA_ID=CAMNT_0007642513 /DNA_START=215 /DNA_END=1864 /DNA_ORIENTATION=-
MKVGHKVPIEITLLYGKGDKVEDQSILEALGGSDLAISTQGMAIVKFRIKEVSMKHENRPFRLKFDCPKSDLHPFVNPVVSAPMTVIRHKLSIRPDAEFPETWYKDEGGRDKYIHVHCVLVDSQNSVVQNREVPLRVVLTYEGDADNEVKDQSILKFSNDSHSKIHRNGMALLKVRIEEVSKNHQKQPFCVKVSPDTSYSPANCDIAIDVSPPITVKSKRNKNKNKRNLKSGRDKKARYDRGMAASSLLDMSGPLASTPFPAEQVAKLQGGDLKTVLSLSRSWCQYVLETLKNMEWHHVGFEVLEGGQINLHRPLYRCPYCWAYKDTLREPRHHPDCRLAKALSSFKQMQIEENFEKLLNAIQGLKSGGPKVPPMPSSVSKLPASIPPLPPLPAMTAATPPSMSMTNAPIPQSLAPAPLGREASLGFFKDATDSAFQHRENPEHLVTTILGVQTKKGFPAFDKKDKLIGFYVYDDNTTTITYFQITQYERFDAGFIKAIEDALKNRKKENYHGVITMEKFITLEQMKDQLCIKIFHLVEEAKNFSVPS